MKTQKRSEDRELNQARSKARYSRPTCKNCSYIFVHHYNSTQYYNTETVLFIFPVLQTNITSHTWPSGDKEGLMKPRH